MDKKKLGRKSKKLWIVKAQKYVSRCHALETILASLPYKYVHLQDIIASAKKQGKQYPLLEPKLAIRLFRRMLAKFQATLYKGHRLYMIRCVGMVFPKNWDSYIVHQQNRKADASRINNLHKF